MKAPPVFAPGGNSPVVMNLRDSIMVYAGQTDLGRGFAETYSLARAIGADNEGERSEDLYDLSRE